MPRKNVRNHHRWSLFFSGQESEIQVATEALMNARLNGPSSLLTVFAWVVPESAARSSFEGTIFTGWVSLAPNLKSPSLLIGVTKFSEKYFHFLSYYSHFAVPDSHFRLHFVGDYIRLKGRKQCCFCYPVTKILALFVKSINC